MNEQEIKRVNEIFLFCSNLMKEKSEEYGDCWKECGLGVRGTFTELNAKYFRLKKLLWDNEITEQTRERIIDTLIDIIN